MNKIIIILITVISIQCYSQSPIVPLQGWDGKVIPEMYVKDVNNILNPFQGTWLYTNGNTSLKIVLIKKTMIYIPNYFEDMLVGEYQYIENGIEKFNSLNDLNTVYPDEYHHNIYGNHIHTYKTPFDDAIAGEIILDLFFGDNMGGDLYIRKKMVGNQVAIEIFKRSGTVGARVGDLPVVAIVPEEVYVLIKQP